MKVNEKFNGEKWILYIYSTAEDNMLYINGFYDGCYGFFNIEEDNWILDPFRATHLTFNECKDFIEETNDDRICMLNIDDLPDFIETHEVLY